MDYLWQSLQWKFDLRRLLYWDFYIVFRCAQKLVNNFLQKDSVMEGDALKSDATVHALKKLLPYKRSSLSSVGTATASFVLWELTCAQPDSRNGLI